MTTELSIMNMKSGQKAGLAYLCANEENWIGVVKRGDTCRIEAVTGGVRYHGPKIQAKNIWLKTTLDVSAATLLYFSLDGLTYLQLGGDCKICGGFWKGARVGLFSYNTDTGIGRADFNWFKYQL